MIVAESDGVSPSARGGKLGDFCQKVKAEKSMMPLTVSIFQGFGEKLLNLLVVSKLNKERFKR